MKIDTKIIQNLQDNKISFVTFCDINYLSRALTLIESIRQSGNCSEIYIAAVDQESFSKIARLNLNRVKVVLLENIEIEFPELSVAKLNRSILEYFFCLTPFLLKYLIAHTNNPLVGYIDADIWFFSNPANIPNNVREYDLSLVTHNFPKHLTHMNKYGINNVGFMYFRRNKKGLVALNWWADKCIKSTSISNSSSEIYGDQKYLDRIAELDVEIETFDGNGHNVAPWNCNKVNYVENNLHIKNGAEIKYYHFSGLRKYKNFSLLGFSSYGWSPNQNMKKRIYANYIKSLIKWELVLASSIRRDNRKLGMKQILKILYFRDYLIWH